MWYCFRISLRTWVRSSGKLNLLFGIPSTTQVSGTVCLGVWSWDNSLIVSKRHHIMCIVTTGQYTNVRKKLYINIFNNICRSLSEISIWSSNKTWVLGGDILVGKHSSRMFLVGNQQVYMHLRRDCGPLLFTQRTSIWQLKASALRSGD